MQRGLFIAEFSLRVSLALSILVFNQGLDSQSKNSSIDDGIVHLRSCLMKSRQL